VPRDISASTDGVAVDGFMGAPRRARSARRDRRPACNERDTPGASDAEFVENGLIA